MNAATPPSFSQAVLLPYLIPTSRAACSMRGRASLSSKSSRVCEGTMIVEWIADGLLLLLEMFRRNDRQNQPPIRTVDPNQWD